MYGPPASWMQYGMDWNTSSNVSRIDLGFPAWWTLLSVTVVQDRMDRMEHPVGSLADRGIHVASLHAIMACTLQA